MFAINSLCYYSMFYYCICLFHIFKNQFTLQYITETFGFHCPFIKSVQHIKSKFRSRLRPVDGSRRDVTVECVNTLTTVYNDHIRQQTDDTAGSRRDKVRKIWLFNIYRIFISVVQPQIHVDRRRQGTIFVELEITRCVNVCAHDRYVICCFFDIGYEFTLSVVR